LEAFNYSEEIGFADLFVFVKVGVMKENLLKLINLPTKKLRQMINIIMKGHWMLKIQKDASNEYPNIVSLFFEMFANFLEKFVLINFCFT